MPDVGTGIAAGSSLVGGYLAGEGGDAADEAEEYYQQAARTAAQQRAIGTEQWQLWKDIYLPYQRQQVAMEQRLLPTRERAEEAALRGDVMDRETYEREVAPVLTKIIDDAMAGVEDRRDYVVGRAAADVATQFGVQREQTQRELERRGVRPGAGQYQAGVRGVGLEEAGARASAVNVARESETRRQEDVNWDRRRQAFEMGAGLRQPRFPGAVAGTGGLTAESGARSLEGAGRGFTTAGGGYFDVAREYGGAARAGIGGALDIIGQKYGDVKFSDIWNRMSGGPGGGVTPQTTRTAGVSPSPRYGQDWYEGGV